MTSAPSSRELIEEALLLIGRTHKADLPTAQAARRELQRWHDSADPARITALEAAQRLWDCTDVSALKDSVALPWQHQARTRRHVLGTLCVGGLAAVAVAAGRWYWVQPVFQVALKSGHGQLLDQALPDGTELSLAARTQLTVGYFRDRREIRLLTGEARFKVAPDDARPFTVDTEWGQTRVLGTTFSVSARHGRMHVAVAEGRVAVTPSHHKGQAVKATTSPVVTLVGGEAIEANAQGMGRRIVVRSEDVGAWRQGWIVFDNVLLSDALERWNDYLKNPLRLGAHPQLRQLRLSGSFPLRNPQAFFSGLPDMLPVKLSGDPGGDITVDLR